MELGNFDLCLRVKNLEKSTDFYKKLGFENTIFDSFAGMSILKKGNITFALYDKHIDETILNFRGGNVFEIAKVLKAKGLEFESDAKIEADGSHGAKLRDPDGNLIYFNTASGEEIN